MKKEVEVVLVPYEPFSKQLEFHKSRAKFRFLITGVGFGKTVAGANEMLKMAVRYPNSLHVILAPNTKMLNNATLPEFYKFAKPFIESERKSRMEITLINGAKIIYLTGDNTRHVDRLRGLTIGSFWLDEASIFPKYVWNILLARLRSSYGPLRGIGTTTPKGFDWVHSLLVKKEDPSTRKPLKNADDYAWFGGTTLDNPFTPQEYKDTLLAQYSGSFRRQEIFGEFTHFEGQVYSQFKRGVHVLLEVPKTKIVEYVFGIDWGFTNPEVGLIVGFDGDGRAYVVEEFYQRRVSVEVLLSWVLERKEKYGLNTGYADPSEPQFIMQFQQAGFNLVAANNQIVPGINAVSKALDVAGDGKPRLFFLDGCVHLLEEITSYRYPDVQEGKEVKDKPLKVDDHAMDALRYVIASHSVGDSGFVVFNVKKKEKAL